MSKALVIGSTVCDIMIYLDKLPQRQGDTHISHQSMSLGGCAFNVANLLHQLKLSYDFISPIGTGIYGDFVKNGLDKLGMVSSIHLEGKNGCCYCFVEGDGERTFLSDHGVEYSFNPNWLHGMNLSDYSYVYVCGLEVEEETGDLLVESLKNISSQIIFAPGPRLKHISTKCMTDLLSLSPIIHLNENEICAYTSLENCREAILALHNITKNTVIVTRGENGVIAFDGKDWYELPAYTIEKVVDTIGAGDNHVAAVIAGLLSQKSLEYSLDFANLVSSKIVQTSGVHLDREIYRALKERL